MSAPPKIDKLAPLLDYLDALTERAPVTELAARLKALDITLDDVAEFIRFDDAQYQRNLVSEARWYHLLVLCWRSGQRSPIHNHAGSTCGMRILYAGQGRLICGPSRRDGRRHAGSRYSPVLEPSSSWDGSGDVAYLLATVVADGHVLTDRADDRRVSPDGPRADVRGGNLVRRSLSSWEPRTLARAKPPTARHARHLVG